MRQTVVDVLRRRLEAAPDEQFIRCGGEWRTLAEVDEASDRLAAGLLALGLTKGDRLAIILPNRQEMVDVFFACAKTGVIQVPINTYLKGDFLRYQLADSGARVALVDADGYRALGTVRSSTEVSSVIVTDDALDGAVADPTVVGYRNVAHSAPVPATEVAEGDLVSILYTSGTTGPSKGCMLSNGYYTISPEFFLEHGWVAPADRIYTTFQLFHGAAHAMLMHALTAPGGSVCFDARFSASTFMARAREESATLLWAFAPMTAAILNQPPRTDDRRPMRLAVIPGLPVSAQTEFTNRFGTPVASEIYGQTECLGVSFSSLAGERRPGTLGPPAPHLDVRLVDDDDHDVPPGEPGEIVVRGRQPNSLYSGYWTKPEATVEAWRNLWHHTGDLATADEAGFLTFLDRKKDSLRRRSENVSSFELEAAIGRHPKIERVAVCAVPSVLGEDDIKACIVLRAGEVVAAEELFAFFKEHLPYFAVPRYVDLRESLPVTAATDRVQKQVLRDEGLPESVWDLDALGLTVQRAERR